MGRLWEQNRLCAGCMNALVGEDTICPHCGFDNNGDNVAHQLPINTILAGKYLIGKALGQGGFGITYIGWDLNLEIKVAVKEYYPEGFVSREQTGHLTVMPYTGDKYEYYQTGCDRFVQEAKVAAKFGDFQSIVHVRDYFRENGTAYIVMEYVEGKTLITLAAEHGGKLPAQEVLACIQPVLRSLAQVHQTNVLHRDISPDNIIIKPNGQIKLLDFGAARQFSLSGERSNTINVKQGFAPEEQYRTHGEQGPWTDVYALCATIYRLITGVTPPMAMDRVMADVPLTPPIELGADLTPSQQDAIIHGLAVRAAERTRDMTMLEAELYGGETGLQYDGSDTAGKLLNTADGSGSMGLDPVTTGGEAGAETVRSNDAADTCANKPSKKKRGWMMAAAIAAFLLLCYGHIQLNLNMAAQKCAEADYSAADRHLKQSIFGGGLYPEYRDLIDAGLLIEEHRFDEAQSQINALKPDYFSIALLNTAESEIKYQKAVLLVEDGSYEGACALFEKLGGYRDSKAALAETRLLWGKEELNNGGYTLALELFSTLKKDGCEEAEDLLNQTYYARAAYFIRVDNPVSAYKDLAETNGYKDAAQLMNSLQDDIYYLGVSYYRNQKYSSATECFSMIKKYERSADYIMLMDLRACDITEDDLWNKLVPLIGFEDAGTLIFEQGWPAIYFMEGYFSGGGYYIRIYRDGGNWYGTWSLPNVRNDSWYFYDGKFYTNDVARLYVEAISEDSIRITHVTTNKTIVLTRS